MTWAKHTPTQDSRWHRVLSVETGGSVLLRCNGRWPASDEYQEDNSPPIPLRCRACLSAVVNAPALSRVVEVQFDLTDADGDA